MWLKIDTGDLAVSVSRVISRKKLIEVALPLDAINAASAREKSIRHGHPSTLHLWWARRPLAAARAVIFAQLVDDPSSVPESFPTEAEQDKERERLFCLVEELVKWENTTNEEVLEQARIEIRKSWRRACEDNADHLRADELFNPDRLPAFHDPFAGGGALPLEAQRLGFEAHASDLNPVAVLINKAMIEIPPRFAGKPPVNPRSRQEKNLVEREWKGARGLAEDVRYYGKWMRDEAERRIGHLYPQVEITEAMARERPDLKSYQGRKLTIIAWIWARTVKSPNPAFADVEVPLASTFMLSTKKGKEAYIEPVIEGHGYRFTVKMGKPIHEGVAKRGTKAGGSRTSFLCLISGIPMPFEYIREEAKNKRMGTRLMAIVAEGDRGKVYLAPSEIQEKTAQNAVATNVPETELPKRALGFRVQEYGMTRWSNLFTKRQLVALTTFSDLVAEAMEQVKNDYLELSASSSHPRHSALVKDGETTYLMGPHLGMDDDDEPLRDSGAGAMAYAEAVGVYLAFALSKVSNIGSSFASWMNDRGAFRETFARQAIPMVWDFAEANPFADAGGSFQIALDKGTKVVGAFPAKGAGLSSQLDAATQIVSSGKLVSTDPPYYDNIGYADLSDFFYIWLRRSLRLIYPEIFATLTVPKAEELIATPYRHGSKEKAEEFFLDGMTQAMHRLAEQVHPGFPVTIYYAFKQSETKGDTGTVSTGWETFLAAVIQSGLSITGTWPMRTEGAGRIVAKGTNALASSIVLVCRKYPKDAPIATRREFVTRLKAELPDALTHLQSGNIAPVDLAQAAIGPGMSVFSRYARVFDAEGNPVSVRDALALINQTLDEALAEQEGDFDADSRWALAWFEQQGFNEGEYGIAETLSKAKNTSIAGIVDAGILESRGGKVRLLKPTELPDDWDPATDPRLPAWEMAHHLVRVLEIGGESAAAELVSRLGSRAEVARELCYRLYTVCERKKRATEALWYNTLVQSWPEITRLAHTSVTGQSEMF